MPIQQVSPQNLVFETLTADDCNNNSTTECESCDVDYTLNDAKVCEVCGGILQS